MSPLPGPALDGRIVACEACPRLREHCLHVASVKRASFSKDTYFGRPVPNFGDPKARLLIVGLAPAAHGANRTGRMFTGDRSGEWLFRALHRSGFANQAECSSADDGLTLDGCLITAICHCAPPDNKPTPEEIDNCSPFLIESIDETPWRVLVCLGGMSWNRVGRIIGAPRLPKFGHGVESLRSDGRIVIASYHPSQQNTFTGKLTEPMLDAIFQRARGLL